MGRPLSSSRARGSSLIRCVGKNASTNWKHKLMTKSRSATDRVLRSTSRITSNGRVLRSRSKQKSVETEVTTGAPNISIPMEKKRRKRRKHRKDTEDEYARTKAQLRYLLNRMNYEKILISAYSTEGWKGLSLEKVKPEKELQRAQTEILRLKLRIRDLFKQLDSLCATGRLPELLFDSEGQIDSEDIFCAKCGSKELTPDNDIILCDGFCDRGFHQLCLLPPMLQEEIPSDDDGWLCPACDCKDDCIDLLNELEGTDLSINSSWEKVFPEAAASGSMENNAAVPFCHSEGDNEGKVASNQAKTDADGSDSDDSEFLSASEDFVKDRLEMLNDDSEDNDYDPDGREDTDDKDKGNSSSDFTSDSEDFDAIFKENDLPLEVESLRRKKVPESDVNCCELNGRASSLMPNGPDDCCATPVSGKRIIDRLDYKKLYDEAYGNHSDSSDDEDYDEELNGKKRKKIRDNDRSAKNGETTSNKKKKAEHASVLSSGTKNLMPETKTEKASPDEGSGNGSSKKNRPSTYKRLGAAVTQRLHQHLNENRYPDKSTKEGIAKDLSLTYVQVDKWFVNARTRFNLRSSIGSKDSETHCSVNAEVESPQTKGSVGSENRQILRRCGIASGMPDSRG